MARPTTISPGDGVIAWARVVASLDQVGYDGVFMLEVAGDGNIPEHVLRAASLLGGYEPAPAGWPAAQVSAC